MIKVERLVTETYTVPMKVLRTKLGLRRGTVQVETLTRDTNQNYTRHFIGRWNDNEKGLVVRFRVERTEYEYRPNR